MENIIVIIAYLLAAYVFVFLFWKKLREDYLPSQIFTASLISLSGLLLFTFSLNKLNSGWWFWWGFLGSIIGLFAAIYKFNMKIFETLDAWIFAGLTSLASIYLIKSINTKERENLLIFGSTLILLVIYRYLNKNYKKFTWYRSGKVGFAGLTVFAIFFVMRFTVALFYPAMLSFVGTGELLLSGGMILVSLILYLNLAKVEK